jgi:hypothetical protein
LILNTLQYLIVDEILLARVLEQKQEFHTQYLDNESTGDEAEEYLDEREYDTGKGLPVIVL